MPGMQRIECGTRHPLFNTATTRRIEVDAAQNLAPYTLMRRAGEAVARLALALAPHAQRVWIACGPGNNGGDGLEAALHLHRAGRQVTITWLGTPEATTPDARRAWERLHHSGVTWSAVPPSDLTPYGLCIDALLGIGVSSTRPRQARAHDDRVRACLTALQQSSAPVLMVDLPSGLDADTGQFALTRPPSPATAPPNRHTLSLLTLKPGLFTGVGRDATGTVWLDTLGIEPAHQEAIAWLGELPAPSPRPHASHKGSYGDVAVIGGEGIALRGMGMTGAALLAASASLHAGAGRVLLTLLDADGPSSYAQQPEIMLRRFDALNLSQLTVVCGCGGGKAVIPVLPEVLKQAPRLVLDADALNAIAASSTLAGLLRQRARKAQSTILTPHPLEAARLLHSSTTAIQANRLQAARELSDRYDCTTLLKGSGSIIATPGEPLSINPTGNARLATAGTGDVLAGWVGAHLAAGAPASVAAQQAAYRHGEAADLWPTQRPLTASALARHTSSN